MHGDGQMAERFMHLLWLGRELREREMRTDAGEPVEIIDPGTLNGDGGPDIRGARLRIGGVEFVGEVEMHRRADDWHAHGHGSDPAYNGVILHVALTGSQQIPCATAAGRVVPLLSIENILPSDVSAAMGRAKRADAIARLAPIPCAVANGRVVREEKLHVLSELGFVRLDRHTARYRRRIENDGRPFEAAWEQALYAGVLDALGYSKNRHAMRRLAEIVPLERIRANAPGIAPIEALLFGASGLFDDPAVDAETGAYVVKLRAMWEALRLGDPIEPLSRGEWNWFRLRPLNFPHLRVAAAARIADRMAFGKMGERILDLFRSRPDASHARRALGEMFRVPAEEYWADYYAFEVRWSSKAPALIGEGRAAEIAVNVALPLGLVYAERSGDLAMSESVRRIYRSFGALEPNERTERINRWLLGFRGFDGAATQQGALELLGEWCEKDACAACEIGRRILI
jgi:hypothetical protein